METKHYLLDPFGIDNNQNAIFDTPFGLLKELLAHEHIELNTYDLGDIARADRILMFDYNDTLFRACVQAGVTRERLVLFAFEPEMAKPEQYQKRVWDEFGLVFTHRDDLVDGKRIRKLRYPQGQGYQSELLPFNDRKFLTLINTNRYSYENNELYSLRRKAIRYFEKRPDFDLYGHGWDDRSAVLSSGNVKQALKRGRVWKFLTDLRVLTKSYSSYRGSVEDKYETMSRYRFSISFENTKESPGYISEKIFDSLSTGTVPVYFGAPNITDYVPAACFIDLRKFDSFHDLERYMERMSKQQFDELQQAGQEFIRSREFEAWRPAQVYGSIVKNLLEK